MSSCDVVDLTGDTETFFQPLDIYLVNPRQDKEEPYSVGKFDLVGPDFGMCMGHVLLKQRARGIMVWMIFYMSVANVIRPNEYGMIYDWKMNLPGETFDALFFSQVDELAKKLGFHFAGMIESVGFLLK